MNKKISKYGDLKEIRASALKKESQKVRMKNSKICVNKHKTTEKSSRVVSNPNNNHIVV